MRVVLNILGRLALRIRLFRAVLLPVLRRVNFSVKVSLNSRRFTIPVHGATGFFLEDDWMNRLLSRLLPEQADSGFIDVGANLGQTLLQVVSLRPEIFYVGFEPNVRAAHYVSDLIEENGLSRSCVLPVALSSEQKIVKLQYEGPYWATDAGASIVADLRPGRRFNVLNVPTCRFDDVIPWLKLPKIDVVKIDVEGAELEVMQGMRDTLNAHRPVLVVEVLLSDARADPGFMAKRNAELMELLQESGYDVYHIKKTAYSLESLKQVISFPSGFCTTEKSQDYDYLFIPREATHRVLSQINLPCL